MAENFDVDQCKWQTLRLTHAWFWTPEWQAKEAEADQEIADGGGPVMSADEFIADLAQRAGLSADDLL
jgi:hypothetical protein